MVAVAGSSFGSVAHECRRLAAAEISVAVSNLPSVSKMMDWSAHKAASHAERAASLGESVIASSSAYYLLMFDVLFQNRAVKDSVS